MYFYYFKAAKNYKYIFQVMHAIKIESFNSCLYFYYINNRIDSLIIIVNLNRVPFITKKRQSYIKLPKKL